MSTESERSNMFRTQYGGSEATIISKDIPALSKTEGEVELIFTDNFNIVDISDGKIQFDIEFNYEILEELLNDSELDVLEVELVVNDELNLIEQKLDSIPIPVVTEDFITIDLEYTPNKTLVLSQSETLQLSVKNDWNIYEKIKYKNLINLKNNKWNSISILFLILESDHLINYLNSFYITEAYIIENDIYHNLFNENYYNQYKKSISEIRRLNYINKSVNTNDSCFIKKQSPQIKALIIGINYIGTAHSLTGSINDANKMEKFFKSHYGEQIEIVKMTDNTSQKLPTTHNIKAEIEKLLTEDKNIILYFAGHTEKQYNIDYTEELDSSNERIRTLDGYISDDWFYSNFIQKINKNVKCRIYIDSCFSHGFSDFRYKYITPNKVELNENIRNVAAHIVSISSSSEYVKSLEVDGEGVFTKQLIDSFEELGNYNVIELFDMFSKAYIMSTFKFDREPILIL